MAIIGKSFDKDQYNASYLVEKEHEGMRLDQYIQLYLKSFSRQAVKKKIEDGDVQIRGRTPPHRPSVKVHAGDEISLVTHNTVHEDEYWHGEKIDVTEEPKIIFDDGALLIISKPPFMATHPTGRHLFNCATVYFESIYKKTVHSIHRLDRETSGLLLLAKNPEAAKEYTAHFENDLVSKCYFFIAHVTPEYHGKDLFICHNRLGSDDEGLKRVVVNSFPENSNEGKEATTSFKVLFKNMKYLLGLAYPKTGRQHQIRVHAKDNGLPLLGDKIYHGGYELFQRFKDNLATDEDHMLMQIPRHALHAIALNMPYQGKRKTFSSPLPLDLINWIKTNIPEVDCKNIQERVSAEAFT